MNQSTTLMHDRKKMAILGKPRICKRTNNFQKINLGEKNLNTKSGLECSLRSRKSSQSHRISLWDISETICNLPYTEMLIPIHFAMPPQVQEVYYTSLKYYKAVSKLTFFDRKIHHGNYCFLNCVVHLITLFPQK